jgi:hypothetical protein
MDCVYICRMGQNEELRYSIRSVHENYPHENIWVVGGRPSWYVGKYVRMPSSSTKDKNARQNLRAVVHNKDISDDFVLMNDDFYVLDKVKKPEYFHGGFLQERVDEYQSVHPNSSYTRLLTNTLVGLRSKYGIKDPIDYELHLPMPMNKDGLAESLVNNMLWRSLYGNINKVGGTEISDVKIYRTHQNNPVDSDYAKIKIPYISTADNSFPIVHHELLKDMFPTPSPHERTPSMFKV